MTKIAVIVGSVREARVSDKLAKWVAAEVGKLAEVEILDLKSFPLPFFEEAISPRYNPNRTPTPEVKKWLDAVADFDGYVVVTPEYNRAMPGVLKNAFDTLGNEMVDKPVALVGHGTVGGAQAVATLRVSIPGSGAITIPNALFFKDAVGQAIDEEGMLAAELQDGPYSPQTQLTGLAVSLKAYADALKNVRG
jgi:NAD(P)H-dependent FMN reductase